MSLNHIVLLAANVTGQVEEKGSMSKALLNTVMGISIVFLVLVLISLIISCFKFIGKIEAHFAKKKAENVVSPVENVVNQIAEREEEAEELSDDLELVAVITAAIHAYEEAQGHEVPANGLFVRSVKKVNKSRWQNA